MLDRQSLTGSILSGLCSTLGARAVVLPISALALILLPLILEAQSCPATLPTGFECVPHGATKEITMGDCLRITNSHAKGKAMMVPIKTSAEWLSFKTGLPAGVTTAACSVGSCTPGTAIASAPGASSFTVPAGCTSLTIEAWGGGGAGSQGYSDFTGSEVIYTGGTGGGSGAYAQIVIAVTPGQVIPYDVGAGGVSGASHGGDTSVVGIVAGGGKTSLAAGEGFDAEIGPRGGNGGTAAGGTINTNGNPGGGGSSDGTCFGGWWAGGYGADAPNGGAGGAGGFTTAGSSGGTPGAGGGGGAYDCDASFGNAGGNGAKGRIKFTY